MKKFIFLSLVCLLFIGTKPVEAQTTYTWNHASVVSGDWSNAANWTPSGIPGASDSVILTAGSAPTTCTINSSVMCRGLYFSTSNKDFSLIISGTNSLTVTNKITYSSVPANGIQLLDGGAGSVTCSGIFMATQKTSNTINRFVMSTGTLTVNGDIQLTATDTIQNDIKFTGTGSFVLNGAVIGTPTVRIGTSAVTYSGTGNQTIPGGTYDGTFSVGGAGVKTLSGTLLINGSGKLMKKGTATLVGTVQYGAGATLEYQDAANGFADTTGDEWPAASGPTNVIINLTGTGNPEISLNASKTLSGTLTMTAGNLAIGANTLTLNGTISGTNGKIKGGSTSNLSIGGTGAFGTLYMDQTSDGTSNVLNNLTVNRTTGGSITLGDSVNVIGVVTPTAGTINTGGYLVLSSTSPTAYGQIAGTGAGTFSGNVKVEKTLSNTTTGWRQIGFPVASSITGINGMEVLGSSHSVAAEQNIFWWDATIETGDTANGWTVAANTDDQNKAYILYGNNTDSVHDISTSIWMTGAPNTGGFNFAVKNTIDPNSTGANDTGWNMIPNPYPSNLDITSLFSTAFGSIAYKAVHVYNQGAEQYQAICSSGVSVKVYNTNGTGISSTVIPPYQAFWIKANSNITFSLANANRTTSMTGAGTFMKKGFDLARIDVTDKSGFSDQVVLYFHNEGTSSFDPQLDALKLFSFNAKVPSLYTVNKKDFLCINALSEMETKHSVALGFRSKTVGSKSISLNTDELDSKWYVYLEDKETGTWHDLRAGSYSFNQTGNTDTRFVVHFTQEPAGMDEMAADKKISVSGDGESIYVIVPDNIQEKTYSIIMNDMGGKLIYRADNVVLKPGVNTLEEIKAGQGIYLLQLVGMETFSSGKVYLK